MLDAYLPPDKKIMLDAYLPPDKKIMLDAYLPPDINTAPAVDEKGKVTMATPSGIKFPVNSEEKPAD